MSDNESQTPTTPATPSTTARSTPVPAGRAGRARRMNWSAEKSEQLQQEIANLTEIESGEPTAEDYAEAAGTMAADAEAAQAAQAAQAAAETEAEPVGETTAATDWSEAFTAAPAPTAEDQGDTEPETGSRDERHRERLRETEADRDRLAGLVEEFRAQAIQRLATPRLADPADLFRDGAAVADMLDEDGRVDPTRVERTISALLDAHPHWRAPLAPYRGPMFSGATSVPLEPRGNRFAEAFAPKTD